MPQPMTSHERAKELSAQLWVAHSQSAITTLVERAIDAAVREERRNICAFMLDRADQYETRSPGWVVLADVCEAVAEGEAAQAAKHGELDDVYCRVDSRATRARNEVKP